MIEATGRDARPPWERLRDLEGELLAAVPAVDPPGCHWLNSDATHSYCWPCAREAAWRELPSIGPAPVEVDWWLRDPMETLIRDRIDGPQSGESDGIEHCHGCGRTLDCLLTDHGVDEELGHYAEHPIAPDETVDGERTYALSRVFLNLGWEGADPDRVEAAVRIAEDALAAARAGVVAEAEGGVDA